MTIHRVERTSRIRRVATVAAALLGMFAGTQVARGHAVSGQVVTLHQPDGSGVSVRAWGDEFDAVLESPDGYTVTRDPSGTLCYARLSPDGSSLVSTGIAVGAASAADLGLAAHLRTDPDASRAQRTVARMSRVSRQSAARSLAVSGQPVSTRTGMVKGVCVLVDFPDDRGMIQPSEIDRLLNQVGYNGYGNHGSVRDYFHDVSDGKLTLTHFVPTSYYTAPHTKSYYENGDFDLVDVLVTQALNSLNSSGLDFSQFDSNNDGFIDSIICLYAGSGSGGLWPHGGQGAGFSADNVHGWNNIVVDIGGSPKIQVLCHELGHSVCEWPDLYDGDGGGDGVAFYCLMGSSLDTNDTNPPPPCAVLRDMAHWADTQALSGPQDGLSLAAAGNVVYKYARPGSVNEYFMIENRQPTGRDANLPSEGLAIWHVDLSKDTNDQQSGTVSQHYMVSLEQADGNRHLEKGDSFASGNDFYAGAAAAFGPETTPHSDWWNGTPSSVRIDNISDSAPTMTFSFTSAAVDPGGTDDPGMQPSGGGVCGAGAAQMFPVILLQLRALKALGRSGRPQV